MKNLMWLVVVLVLGGLAAAYFYWQSKQDLVLSPAAPVSPPAAPAPPKKEPAIRHPVKPVPDAELPPPERSDGTLTKALVQILGAKPVQELFALKDLARRFVVTVDNLPRRHVPMKYRLFNPVEGKFQVLGKGEEFLTEPANMKRYGPYVLLADSVDTKRLVQIYVHFYPLFQQEYVKLGYPHGYFNDRLVEAIDDLLTAPEVPGQIRLVRPKVLYQYADPALENLSAGQKIMVRMGVENAARIKAHLREIRKELVQEAPSQ